MLELDLQSNERNDNHHSLYEKRFKLNALDFVNLNMEPIFNRAAKELAINNIEYIAHLLEFKRPYDLNIEFDFYGSIEKDVYFKLENRIKFYVALELSKHIVQIPFKLNISTFNSINLDRAFEKALKIIKSTKALSPETELSLRSYTKIEYELADSEFCLLKTLSIEFRPSDLDNNHKYKLIKGRFKDLLKQTVETEIRNHYMNRNTKSTDTLFPKEIVMQFWNDSI